MKSITLSGEINDLLLRDFPSCSDRFVENLLIILLNRAESAQFDRRNLTDSYRKGALQLRPLVEQALKLNDENLELLFRNLFRKETAGKAVADIDFAICYLDDTEKLTQLSSRDARDRISSYLQARGGGAYKFTAAAYRRRIERLQRKGVKLLCL